MSVLTVTIKPNRKIHIEMDADRFERLAANLGLFTKAFLESIERAEKEITSGKTRRLKNLADILAK